jgi:hypothetical protein
MVSGRGCYRKELSGMKENMDSVIFLKFFHCISGYFGVKIVLSAVTL